MTRRTLDPHATLKAEQRDASDPGQHVWLSASAGTGKTYVLSARVLRLLLRGVRPDTILCLTFTKAGAAEMAERVHDRLARWVQLSDADLAADLRALDEEFGRDQVGYARTLFARVLEARGGGLRIMTIHAFCQTLLAGFPLEAGLSPGFRPLEGRARELLAQEVLTELVVTAEQQGDRRLLDDLRALSLRLGESEVLRFLMRSATAADALETLGPGVGAIVRRAMAVPADYSHADVVAACEDGAFDRAALLTLLSLLETWGTARAQARGDIITTWLAGSAEFRAAGVRQLASVWCKEDGALFTSKGWAPPDPGYREIVEPLHAWCDALTSRIARAALAADVTAALGAAQRYARALTQAKLSRGLVDFDDQIQLTRKLLSEVGMGDWIRYKLDAATDHILIDEAQDTNADQWAIVAALAGEYWAGQSAKPDMLRTLFTVGDFKQAIFGFQGTDPEIYRAVGKRFSGFAEDAGQEIVGLSLDRSFRSTPPVLAVVDAVLENIGSAALGLDEVARPHVSAKGGGGEVLLLSAISSEGDSEDAGEEDWVSNATRLLATRLARQVKAWLAAPMWLSRDGGRALSPGDVMILVRKRSDLAALLVARLHEERVPVAGVDRLRLQAPLAVQDLLAAMRFASQPRDDLTLAALLVSPLIGWSQDDLFAVAHGRAGALWDAIPAGETRDQLRAILNAADNITPYAFLENLLSGALDGRRKLLARLGDQARDPIDELLNAALQFEREGVASLQQFLDWIDRGDTDVVRDAGAAGNAVRVMTVHAAKGLQAPLVILADACADPERALERNFKWTIDGVVDDLPLFRPRGAERALVGSLQDSMANADDKALKEHWRLLYVAMTRAEERLVIAGALGPQTKGVVPDQSWHAAVTRAMLEIGAEHAETDQWVNVLRYGDASTQPVGAKRDRPVARTSGNRLALATTITDVPAWLHRPAPQEARPPRPLAPSSIGRDDSAYPPTGIAMAAAADRGRYLHALFERLPPLAAGDRRAAGARWLAVQGADVGLVDAVLTVIEDSRFAAIFAPGTLAEAPIAGVVNGVVIAGVVDRLAVTETRVELVDFKTGRRLPASVDDVPVQHLRQMAAYAAVLESIFPDRPVHASLLYAEGPILHRLPPELLAAHKPSFVGQQDIYATAG